MPYVEGFGTYPFGEEWLFDAIARSHLPVLTAARDLSITITPVLADQLEAAGVGERLERFVRRHRLEAAARDVRAADADLRAAAGAEERRYSTVLAQLEDLDGDLLAPFRNAAAERNVELVASAATHAVLPLLATRAGGRLQVGTGMAAHARRFGPARGFWLPECAYRPGVEGTLGEHGVGYFCVDQSRQDGELEGLAPVGTAAGLVAFTIDWPSVELVWSARGYPADPAYAEYHRQSLSGTRLWAIGGGPYDPGAAAARAREHAESFVTTLAERLGRFAAARGRRGLLVFAIDTELLGAWWSEGPLWLAHVLDLAPGAGVRLVTLGEALARHPPEARPLRESSWGENKDLSTWDSPDVADLAWAARRLELRLLRALGAGTIPRRAAERAARELLAVQSSDWAFMDRRGQAGDYPFQRVTAHAQAMLEALDCAAAAARMRNLAPDLTLSPLLEP